MRVGLLQASSPKAMPPPPSGGATLVLGSTSGGASPGTPQGQIQVRQYARHLSVTVAHSSLEWMLIVRIAHLQARIADGQWSASPCEATTKAAA
jgi:hypothetical protein